jgi:hypothetical protein
MKMNLEEALIEIPTLKTAFQNLETAVPAVRLLLFRDLVKETQSETERHLNQVKALNSLDLKYQAERQSLTETSAALGRPPITKTSPDAASYAAKAAVYILRLQQAVDTQDFLLKQGQDLNQKLTALYVITLEVLRVDTRRFAFGGA